MDAVSVQSRRASFVEAACNVALGYVLAVVTQWIVFPIFGLPDVSAGAHLGIGACFVAVSLARSYAIRRAFEAWR